MKDHRTITNATMGEPGLPVPRRRRVLVIVVTLVASFVIGMLGLELAVRAVLPITDTPWTFYDPVLGPRIAPNQSGRYIAGDHIRAQYHFNAQGWNHPSDYTVTRPAGTVRVCLIGDSQVESLQVDPGETMFAVAERRMTRPDRAAQWYAFGNSGWGTAHHLELVRHYVLDYEPDVVILLFIQNDPFDCSPYLVNIERQVPCYRLDEDGELILRPPGWWTPSWRGRAALSSALFRYFVVQKKVNLRHQGKIRDIGGLPLRDTGGALVDDVPALGSMSMRQREEKTWQLIEAMFRRMRDECSRRGAVFAIAFRGWHDEIEQPLGAAFSPPPPRQTDPFCLGDRRCEMGREMVGPMAARLGIPYLDLTNALKGAVARMKRSHRFPDDMHLSAFGHQYAGEALADWVETVVLPKRGLKPQPSHDR